MKHIILVILASFLTCAASAQCCSAHDAFNELASNESFRNDHEEPLAFRYEGPGEQIEFKCEDGKNGNAFYIEGKGSKWVLLIHEWWGLNDFVKNEAKKLSEQMNYHVLCLDLYDGKVATDRPTASKYMKEAKEERIRTILRGVKQYVGSDAQIATMGWCFGGGWSLQTSLFFGKQAEACVIYYGMPEKDVEKLKTLNCPVLGIWASEDGWINAQVVSEFEHNMKSAGKALSSYTYQGKHAFANPSNPQYESEATADAWSKSMAFLAEEL